MSTELSKNVESQLPAFMQNEEVLGTEGLDKYVRPPRLKIVQAMAKEPYDRYDKGTVLLVPQMLTFAEYDRDAREGMPFKFVPLFFYPEWIQTNPLSKQPFIRGRTLDPRHEIALKAQNQETWFEPHPDDPELEIANREIMNFVIMPYGHSIDTPCVLQFSKAGFRDGSNLASIIKMRKAPIFGQVFTAMVSERKNDKGQWFGYDIDIPEKDPFVTQEEYEAFKAAHIELKKSHAEGILQVDYEDGKDKPQQEESTEF